MGIDSGQIFDYYQMNDGSAFSGHLRAHPGHCLVMGQQHEYDLEKGKKTFPVFKNKVFGLPEDTEVEVVSF